MTENGKDKLFLQSKIYNKNNTLIIIKTEEGKILGGYSKRKWNNY